MARKLRRFSENQIIHGWQKQGSSPGASKTKHAIRQSVLEAIGADKARVFDAFAGEGGMYDAVWKDAAHYVGCDKTWFRDARTAYVGDNLRVMRAIDLSAFNIFDLDAWGSPWEQAYIIAHRRNLAEGEKIGMVMTDGSNIRMHLGFVPKTLALLNGIKPKVVGPMRYETELIDTAFARIGELMGAVIAKRWQALTKSGTPIRYSGIVYERPMRQARTRPTSVETIDA